MMCVKAIRRTYPITALLSGLFLVGVLFSSRQVEAGIGGDFGFGPQSSALAGNSTSWSFDGYAAYNNPAGLPLINRSGSGFPESRFALSYGVIYMKPSFLDITGVITSNTATGGVSNSSPSVGPPGSVDTSYRDTFGQMIGLAWRADPDWYNVTVGLTAFLPIDQLAYIDTGESFEPFYFLYRSRNQQPDVSLSVGAEFTPWFRVGMGLHVAYTLTSQADANLATSAPSTARLQTSIKPKVSPFFGFQISEDESASAGLVVRLPSSEDSSFEINSSAQVIGSLPALPFAFIASSTIIYDPLSIELGGSFKASDALRLFLQMDYQFWSQFQAPILEIANPQVVGCGSSPCGIILAPGPTLGIGYRNTLTPRIAGEFTFGTTKLRAGYAYKPGILSGLPTGVGNYLDPDRHIITTGMGFIFQRFLGYHKPWNLDFSLDFQKLVTQQITKTPGDENGSTASQKIGAPGYQAGGFLAGGQVALTLGI